MSERALRSFFVIVAGAMLLSLIAALAWRPEPKRPDDPAALAAWIEAHPADAPAAIALTEGALDASVVTRFDLWRAAHQQAEALDPRRPEGRVAFVRGAFFHWYELDDRDKRAVLTEATPLLRDPQTFRSMAPPLWRLTRDFAFLRRAAGNNGSSLTILRDIAATNGLFAEYRALRADVTRARLSDFEIRNRESDPIDYIPHDCTTDDQALIEAILADLHDHPIDKSPSNPQAVERLIDYAIRHHVGPLDGLDFLARDSASISAPIRARLSIALGDMKHATLIETAGTDTSAPWGDYYIERAAYEHEHGDPSLVASYLSRAAASRKERLQWSGRCVEDICTSAHKLLAIDQPNVYTISLARVSSDEVPPYVELYVDDARFSEAAITGEQTFTTPLLTPGEHRIDVRIANPFTRNLSQRRLRIVRESPL